MVWWVTVVRVGHGPFPVTKKKYQNGRVWPWLGWRGEAVLAGCDVPRCRAWVQPVSVVRGRDVDGAWGMADGSLAWRAGHHRRGLGVEVIDPASLGWADGCMRLAYGAIVILGCNRK